MAQTLRVKGLRELIRACDKSAKHVKKGTRTALRRAGDIVKVDARDRFADVDSRSAGGYRTVVRQRGVSVEQSIGRTTGTRPDYGAKQMREALSPALDAKRDEVEQEFEDVLDELARNF